MEKIDVLSRDEFVGHLIQLTENISKNKVSTSFAVNGKWGSGKSFVFDMYEEKLKGIQSEETKTNKYLIIRYNCWKYDYYEEPLVAIVAAMLDVIEQETKNFNGERVEKVKGVLKAVGATLLSISTNALKTATGVDLKEPFAIIKSIKSGIPKGTYTCVDHPLLVCNLIRENANSLTLNENEIKPEKLTESIQNIYTEISTKSNNDKYLYYEIL